MNKIFIIHGWTYTTDAWDQCVQELRKSGLEAVLLNVPGLSGESSEVWTLQKYVEWLREILQSEEKSILVGHSNGGRIAIAFAARYPEKVSKLILIGSAGIVHNELPIKLKRAVFGVIAKVGKKFTSSALVRKIFYRVIGARDYERAPEHMRETMKNMIAVDLKPELSKISTPTLLIWGRGDTATPLADGHIMNREIQNSKLIVIKGAKHSPHMTHPEMVAQAIQNFIQ